MAVKCRSQWQRSSQRRKRRRLSSVPAVSTEVGVGGGEAAAVDSAVTSVRTVDGAGPTLVVVASVIFSTATSHSSTGDPGASSSSCRCVRYLTAAVVFCLRASRLPASPSPRSAGPLDCGTFDCRDPTGGLFHNILSISFRPALCQPCFRPSIADLETLNTSLHSMVENFTGSAFQQSTNWH